MINNKSPLQSSQPQDQIENQPGLWQRIKKLWPIAAALGFAFLGVFLYNLLYPPAIPMSESEINESISQIMASATPEAPYSSLVYQTILPSVVYIETEVKNNAAVQGFGVGTGVVINESGDILTALHVVADTSKISVYFADGSAVTAKILAADPQNDIAVLHPDELPDLVVPAVLGNANAMRVGDEAFAVGNPYGLVASMSAGVISGFDRSIPIGEENVQRFDGLIQFDTAVNPGNSGGPLLNRQGQVIGIVTALANPSDQPFFVGIGFAVPIGTAVTTGGGGPSY